MKKIFASLLSLSLLLLACTFSTPTSTATAPAPTASPSEVSPTADVTPVSTSSGPDPLETPWDDRSLFQGGLVESQQAVLDDLAGASIYHIEFNIDDSIYQISGHQDVRYTNKEDVDLNEVQFRLFPNILGGEIDVSNVTVDGQEITPEFGLENSLLIIRLRAALEPGQSVEISMDFDITVPQSVELNYGVLAYADNVLALAHAYPMICVYDDEGWNSEIPPQDGDVTYGETSFYIVKISAPKDLTLVATGSEIHRDEAGQTQTVYVASGPARDFYLVASSEYQEISETFGDVTIRSYAPAGLAGGAEMALDVAAKAIDVFSQRYAPYPYTEFDIVSTPTLALGIEYPGMVAITSRIYDVSGEYAGAPTSVYMESTVAHEVGHQWFYALVGDDQLDDPWLDESLTQFITLQYYEDEHGPQAAQGFRESLEGRWARVGNADIPIGLPVASYDGAEYGAIVYGRGPLFFDALKAEMGTQNFDAFLHDYTESLSWDIATPEFLQSLAEQHCACELDTLFEEWVYP
jgi:aminopeptidase N